MSIFERASRLKLRFSGVRGNLSAEDLWDLSEQELKGLFRELALASRDDAGVESLEETSTEDAVLTLRKDVVRHVFTTKKEERLDRAVRAEKSRSLQKLLDARARKQDAETDALELTELDAKIAELKGELS